MTNEEFYHNTTQALVGSNINGIKEVCDQTGIETELAESLEQDCEYALQLYKDLDNHDGDLFPDGEPVRDIYSKGYTDPNLWLNKIDVRLNQIESSLSGGSDAAQRGEEDHYEQVFNQTQNIRELLVDRAEDLFC